MVSDNTIVGEGLGDFIKILAEKGLNASEKISKNVFKNPARALGIGANFGTAFASSSPKAAL